MSSNYKLLFLWCSTRGCVPVVAADLMELPLISRVPLLHTGQIVTSSSPGGSGCPVWWEKELGVDTPHNSLRVRSLVKEIIFCLRKGSNPSEHLLSLGCHLAMEDTRFLLLPLHRAAARPKGNFCHQFCESMLRREHPSRPGCRGSALCSQVICRLGETQTVINIGLARTLDGSKNK